MAQRIPWDMSEAVILLDALIAAREGKISRKDAIESVSSELRIRAKRRGVEVDDIFRGEVDGGVGGNECKIVFAAQL